MTDAITDAPPCGLPWTERVTQLSIHPDAASRDDVARLATEHLELTQQLETARARVAERDALAQQLEEAQEQCATLAEIMEQKSEGRDLLMATAQIRAKDRLIAGLQTRLAALEAVYEAAVQYIQWFNGDSNEKPLSEGNRLSRTLSQAVAAVEALVGKETR